MSRGCKKGAAAWLIPFLLFMRCACVFRKLEGDSTLQPAATDQRCRPAKARAIILDHSTMSCLRWLTPVVIKHRDKSANVAGLSKGGCRLVEQEGQKQPCWHRLTFPRQKLESPVESRLLAGCPVCHTGPLGVSGPYAHSDTFPSSRTS